MAQSPRPHLNAIVLCDHVHLDPTTSKYTLLGTFDRIFSRQFPAVCPSAALFVNFSDAQGEYRLRIEVISLDQNVVIAEHTMEPAVVVADRLEAANVVIVLQGMTFQEAGKYAVRLYANDQFLGEKPFHVQLVPTVGEAS